MTKKPNPRAIFETRSAPIRYKGYSTPANLTAWWDEDGDAILEGENLIRRDERYAALRDLVDDLSSPASLRGFREALNLSQEQASELIDVASGAFAKYESDETQVSKPVLNLLRLIAKHPELLHELDIDPEVEVRQHRAKTRPNRQFRLRRTKGLGSSPMIRVEADGLKTHIHLIRDKSGEKPYHVMSQRMGVRKGERVLYRRGPLDDLPPEEVVRRAVDSVGLDPRSVTWPDIWEAAEDA